MLEFFKKFNKQENKEIKKAFLDEFQPLIDLSQMKMYFPETVPDLPIERKKYANDFLQAVYGSPDEDSGFGMVGSIGKVLEHLYENFSLMNRSSMDSMTCSPEVQVQTYS